jgi:autotransporter translocation and assembly factor TamB
MRRAASIFGLALLALLVVVAAGLVFVLQAAPGHRLVLRTAVDLVDARIQGDFRVGGIRSAGLLRGLTLDRVSILDEQGRPFLEADSVRVGYSVRGFLARDAVLEPVELWRPRVTMETLPGDTVPNVTRIFAGEPADPGEATPPGNFRLELRRVRVHDGTFTILAPDTEPSAFRQIEARIRSAVLLDPADPGERVVFESLSLEAELGELGQGPFRVSEFQGELRRRGTRLDVEADLLRLVETRLEGRLALDWTEDLQLELDLEADPFHASDLAWLDPRIPDARGRFLLLAGGPVTGGEWRFDNVDLRVGENRVRGRVAFELGDEFRILESEVEAELGLELLDPWLDAPLPVQGRVVGGGRVSGVPGRMRLDLELAFDDPARGIPASRATVAGLVNVPAATVAGLRVRVDPLRLATLRAFLPEATASELALAGEGSLEMEATGGLASGLRLDAQLFHSTAAMDLTRVSIAGTVRQQEGEVFLEMDTSLDPLSLTGVEGVLGVELPVRGDLRGELRLVGPLTDLTTSGQVETAGGPVTLVARLDATDPARSYRLQGEVEGLELGAFLRQAPEGSRLSGRFRAEGSGFELATLETWVQVQLDESRWGDIVLDGGEMRVAAGEGRLDVQDLELRSVLGNLEGSGDLALAPDAADGRVEIRWTLADLGDLRPLLLGGARVDPDTLSALERSLREMEGIDPDPTRAIPLGGTARADLVLEGGVDDLRARLHLSGADLAWREVEVAVLDLEATARLERGEAGHRFTAVGGDVHLASPSWGRFAFEEITAQAAGTPEELDVSLDLRRSAGEAYHTAGNLVLREQRVAYRAAELRLDLDDVVWQLARPGEVSWEGGIIQVDDLEITRPAGAGPPVLIRVQGSVDLEGPLDLRARASGVDLARLSGILQLDPAPEGLLELDLTLNGVAAAPRVQGRFVLLDLLVADTRLSRVAGTLDYAEEQARIRLEVDQNGNRLLTVSGGYPVNLALTRVENRFPSREVDLLMEIDDLPAATALGPLDVLEDVDGVLDGRIEFRGEPDNLQPSGVLRLRGGRFSLPEIGLSPSNLEATFTLTPDGRVEVDARGRSVGPVRLTGSVDLSTLSDPGFELEVVADGFQAVNRRDLEGRVSGTVFLRGSYTAPRVTGAIRVDQANLFLEEFARIADVVDLTDPLFFERAFLDDAAAEALRPVLEATRNPFLDNLRVDADLSLPRDVWLRSREMNVEIGGDLIVTFDRRDREILLVGSVAAVRGNYNAFGRQFQVRSGTVDFVGTPGINPALSIEAVHRLRQQGGEPLEIVAELEGTLLAPRISLRSDSAVDISESDLISYLIFGRPSYALGSAESRMLGDAAISAGIGAAAGQLSSLLGQQFGLDFFAITQAQDAGAGLGALSGDGLVDTQVELGQYLTDNIFLALILRPLRGIGGSQAQIPGARLEWRFTDAWTFNAYVEDRFGREGVYTFGEAGLQVNRIFGLELFREWGY